MSQFVGCSVLFGLHSKSCLATIDAALIQHLKYNAIFDYVLWDFGGCFHHDAPVHGLASGDNAVKASPWLANALVRFLVQLANIQFHW
jgi:hypothetical protein